MALSSPPPARGAKLCANISSSSPSASSSSSCGGLLCGSAKRFSGVPLPRGNVLLAFIELPRKERGGGPSGVVEMFVRYVGGSCDGVVLFGGGKKNLGSRGGVLGKSSESGTLNMLAVTIALVGAAVYLVVGTTINSAQEAVCNQGARATVAFSCKHVRLLTSYLTSIDFVLHSTSLTASVIES
jgi:hypothetical protein